MCTPTCHKNIVGTSNNSRDGVQMVYQNGSAKKRKQTKPHRARSLIANKWIRTCQHHVTPPSLSPLPLTQVKCAFPFLGGYARIQRQLQKYLCRKLRQEDCRIPNHPQYQRKSNLFLPPPRCWALRSIWGLHVASLAIMYFTLVVLQCALLLNTM